MAQYEPEPIFGSPLLHPSFAAEEVRVVDPNTGGAKGSKLERHDLIPPEPIEELARVYGMGAAKYEENNYLKGYDWGLSIAALDRHIKAWLKGESYDEESGLHHLAHACWHTIALQMFEKYSLGTDNRVSTWLKNQGASVD